MKEKNTRRCCCYTRGVGTSAINSPQHKRPCDHIRTAPKKTKKSKNNNNNKKSNKSSNNTFGIK